MNRFIARISSAFMIRNTRKSEVKTIDLVVDHVLIGILPEMLDWWWDNIQDTERYKLWHPQAHKSFEWEVFTEHHIGNIHTVVETIGPVTTKLRIRWEDPHQTPIQTKYKHVLAGSILDDHDNPITWITHEYERIPEGTKMRSTFRLPANIPKLFIENLKQHDIEEMAEFQKFLPKLYHDSTSKKKK